MKKSLSTITPLLDWPQSRLSVRSHKELLSGETYKLCIESCAGDSSVNPDCCSHWSKRRQIDYTAIMWTLPCINGYIAIWPMLWRSTSPNFGATGNDFPLARFVSCRISVVYCWSLCSRPGIKKYRVPKIGHPSAHRTLCRYMYMQ